VRRKFNINILKIINSSIKLSQNLLRIFVYSVILITLTKTGVFQFGYNQLKELNYSLFNSRKHEDYFDFLNDSGLQPLSDYLNIKVAKPRKLKLTIPSWLKSSLPLSKIGFQWVCKRFRGDCSPIDLNDHNVRDKIAQELMNSSKKTSSKFIELNQEDFLNINGF